MSALDYLPFVLLALFAVMGVLVFLVLPAMGRRQQEAALAGVSEPVLTSAAKQIKAAVCDACGARKVQPTSSPYLYCDYCGALVDYDMRLARALDGYQNRPAKVWSDLVAVDQPWREQALRDRDQDGFRRSFAQVVAQHMARFPGHFSPRSADPTYREAVTQYMVELNLAVELDAELQRLGEASSPVQARVHFQRRPGQPPLAVGDEALDHLLRTDLAYLDRFCQVAEPVRHLHPDNLSAEKLRTFTASRMVQNWLPNLSPAHQQRFIAAHGLRDDYVALVPVQTQTRHCGHCGRPLEAVAGARRVLCAHCGHYNDAARSEIHCPTCAAPISIPDEKTRFPCPHCHDEVRVEG